MCVLNAQTLTCKQWGLLGFLKQEIKLFIRYQSVLREINSLETVECCLKRLHSYRLDTNAWDQKLLVSSFLRLLMFIQVLSAECS